MLFKLALRNIRRSVKDYTIYFVTLLIAITVFYAFNSISDQQIMQEVNASGKSNIVEFTGFMMGIFSTVVALVLGFLVIYANQLLIRRRKREFGMYFTLGMTPGHVSRIILYETVMVGIVSLLVGLALGVIVSQLLSFATAALFAIPMPDYQFTFSMHSFIMTLVCFAAIYVVVALFNVVSIRHCKLIDLINADAKSQKVVIRNPWVCLCLFIVSLGILGVSYWQLEINGMTFIGDESFVIATVLMLVGTLLFFFSLAGFVIALVTRLRGFYLKKLRPFTTRQIASKVNTSFASMWVVCVLLFFAITTFGTGMALANLFSGDIDRANPYDASIISTQEIAESQADDEGAVFDITQTEQLLSEKIKDWSSLIEDTAQIDIYELPYLTYGDVIDKTGATIESTTIRSVGLDVIGISQYNDARELQGLDAVALDDDEYIVTNTMSVSENLARAMVDQNYALETPSGTLMPLSEVQEVQLEDYSVPSNGATMVVPDSMIADLAEAGALQGTYINLVYRSGAEGEELDEEAINALPGVSQFITRDSMIEQAMGLKMLITYLALYIGLVLLVATAAVLAIQLLSLTIDSAGRYRALSRLGCDTSMLSRSLLAQVVIYFVLPLVVAACHSAWTIWLMSGSLFDAFGVNMLQPIALSVGFVLLIYGGYLVITYFASRATVVSGLSQSR